MNDKVKEALKELYEKAGAAFGHTGGPLETFIRELEHFIEIKMADAAPGGGKPLPAAQRPAHQLYPGASARLKPKKRK